MPILNRAAAIGAASLACLLVAPLGAHAAEFRAGDILIENPWTRATPGGARVAGGYMRITNLGGEPDRLIDGSSEMAARFEVHSMTMDGDVARMAPVEGGLVIPPGETVELAPGGYHVMFMELQRPLERGETVTGTLVFEQAGEIEITYDVAAMGVRSHDHGHAHDHGHTHGHGHGHKH